MMRTRLEQLHEWHRAVFFVRRVPSTMHASSQIWKRNVSRHRRAARGSSSSRMGLGSPWPSQTFLTSVSSASRILLAGARMYCKRPPRPWACTMGRAGVNQRARLINVGRCRIPAPDALRKVWHDEPGRQRRNADPNSSRSVDQRASRCS
jgi:hypothetical protein